MTLIECFTDSHMDNFAACLRLQPDKLILVGDAEQMHTAARRYKNLLQQRGQKTLVYTRDVMGKDLGDICAVLEQLILDETACIIDLTGGDEPVIMAVGAVLAGLEPSARQRVRVEKYDPDTGAILDCIHDNRKIQEASTQLTVSELVCLYGGVLHPDTYQPPLGASCRDIDGLWRIIRDMPREWNRAITYLKEFESRSDSKTQVFLPLNYLSDSIPNFDQKLSVVQALLDKFQRYGVIDDFSSRNFLEYTYRSPLLRHCTYKEGNLLEVKTLLEGRRLLCDGKPLFHDCRMGVSIDWDGTVHTPEEHIAETRNEIDVIFMRGQTPLFVSCKNGKTDENELYKLNTVAERFGGPYARKMLIATDMDRDTNRGFIQRAWDMDIYLVTDAAKLSHEDWEEEFRLALR